MKIIQAKDVLHVVKPEGTDVHYYLFNEYELHYNEQAPHTTQTWHHHEKISESLYIISGELVAKWKEGSEEKSQIVKAGDLIETQTTPHTFSNETDEIIKFIVIKRVDAGKNYKEILKSDKILD